MPHSDAGPLALVTGHVHEVSAGLPDADVLPSGLARHAGLHLAAPGE